MNFNNCGKNEIALLLAANIEALLNKKNKNESERSESERSVKSERSERSGSGIERGERSGSKSGEKGVGVDISNVTITRKNASAVQSLIANILSGSGIEMDMITIDEGTSIDDIMQVARPLSDMLKEATGQQEEEGDDF